MKGYIPIKIETLTELANEVRRLCDVSGELSTAEMITGLQNVTAGGLSMSVQNYAYERSTGLSTHSRTYTGTSGNILFLAVMHRGELTAPPAGWELIGTLTESGDRTAGSVAYNQYVSIFTKICAGEENIEYTQTQTDTSFTCIIEFQGVSGFEILEDTRRENVSTDNTPEFSCTRTNSTVWHIWITTAIFFNGNQYHWNISDENVWAMSDYNNIQPRLGVFVDNRSAPSKFTIDSLMAQRYVSGICIQVNPK